MELEKEIEKLREELLDVVSEELGIPKDLMSKGVINIEKEQVHYKYQVPKPKLDLEGFKSNCDKMRELVEKMTRAEAKRQDEMLILQILYVYETGMDFWQYKAFMLRVMKEVEKENPNGNFRFKMLTNEQVAYINEMRNKR